ncbi:MAG: hypothetical protein ABIJ05_00955 [Patescibacteria group bacterium]
MYIKTYIKEYTSGNKIGFNKVFDEIKELFIEIIKFNKKGIKEEYQDVLHFFQLWLYWQFGLNGKLWKSTKESTKKFMARKKMWQEIYKYVELDKNISNFCGNYNKPEKVIKHLSRFGIPEEKSKEAYKKVCLK